MSYAAFAPAAVRGTVRTLSQQEELPLLRDHLLRLDRGSRHDRFHGFLDDSFIERYAEKCAKDDTVIVAYFEDGVVRGAAELHPPEQSPDGQPEIAFSVERAARRKGVGSILFRKLIAEARAKGYRDLRITTGAQNEAMRALANKFGARLTFQHGESTGTIDLAKQKQPEPEAESTREAAESAPAAVVPAIDPAGAFVNLNRAYWRMLMQMYGWDRAA